MRFLFLSNLYPPTSRGGYEQWCEEVALALQQRGHEVHVLTSGPPNCAVPGVLATKNSVAVHRKLHSEVSGGLPQTVKRLLYQRQRLAAENQNALRVALAEIQPDAALVWGMWNIDRNVPATLETSLPGRVAYYLCDYWPTYPSAYLQRWQEPARRPAAQWMKQLLGWYFLPKLEQERLPSLQFERPICVSRSVRQILQQKGVVTQAAQVIYGGTQVEDFLNAQRWRQVGNSRKLRLVYIGRLERDKGVHTALRAIETLSHHPKVCANTLSFEIYGRGDPEYTAWLQAFVRLHRLEEIVTFCGSVPRSEIPAVLAKQDVLLFPSEWQEPFARSVLEAMAAGLTVVGSTAGGTPEIVVEGETGVTFPAGDAARLASQVLRLFEEPTLRCQLAQNGQEKVLTHFRFERMVDELEDTLRSFA